MQEPYAEKIQLASRSIVNAIGLGGQRANRSCEIQRVALRFGRRLLLPCSCSGATCWGADTHQPQGAENLASPARPPELSV